MMRQTILHGFQRHFARTLDESELEERVRIEDGRVLAYSYQLEELFAMWMVPIGLVQFYDAEGNMLQTLDLTSAAAERRSAA
jgi:hypothetical protein